MAISPEANSRCAGWRATSCVDGASGSDDSDCSDPGDPCATIGYALNYAGSGDEILVARGTYTENVVLVDGQTVILRGGYTVSGTAWLSHTAETCAVTYSDIGGG